MFTGKVDEERFFRDAVKDQTFPRNDALKQIILKRVMKDFKKYIMYSEDDVNKVIREHFEDTALIRRELVNFGYMERDPFEGNYWVKKKELKKEDYLRITRLRRHAKEIGALS